MFQFLLDLAFFGIVPNMMQAIGLGIVVLISAAHVTSTMANEKKIPDKTAASQKDSTYKH